MICLHFRDNWIAELPDIVQHFSKRELTFIFSRDSNGYSYMPFCRYGYTCIYRHIDCPIPYFKRKYQNHVQQPIVKQLTLF